MSLSHHQDGSVKQQEGTWIGKWALEGLDRILTLLLAYLLILDSSDFYKIINHTILIDFQIGNMAIFRII